MGAMIGNSASILALLFVVLQAANAPAQQPLPTLRITLNAGGWMRFESLLAQYAPGTTQGYARVTRTAGSNPFISYAVVTDGGQPGERSGDAAFVFSSP
jgi:hypothetical protein